MSRIKIDDLPERMKVSPVDMKKVLGGYGVWHGFRKTLLPRQPSEIPFMAMPEDDSRLRWGIVDQLGIPADKF